MTSPISVGSNRGFGLTFGLGSVGYRNGNPYCAVLL